MLELSTLSLSKPGQKYGGGGHKGSQKIIKGDWKSVLAQKR